MSALLTQSPGDTVQTGTGKVDPARKFKCTTAARAADLRIYFILFRYPVMVFCMNQSVVFLRNKAVLIYEYVFTIDSIQIINFKEL